MGRPNKYNLQYFPLDVDFFDDHKMISIEEVASIKGGYIALRLMTMVYADKGYYLEWPDKFEFTAAKRIGNNVTGAQVAEIFKLCLKHELFNKQVFDLHRIVTSSGIQKRWLMVMNALRRKIEVNVDYWLISSEQTPVTSEETSVNVAESTQKEIKLNESKVENVRAADAATDTAENLIDTSLKKPKSERKRNAGRRNFVEPTFEEVKNYFTEKIGDSADPRSWPEIKINMQAGKFIDHYKANGWVQSNKKPIVDWQAAVRNWIRNAQEGAFTSTPTNGTHINNRPQQPQEKRIESRSLTNMQNDINYLYESFLEGKCTVISIESSYYDHMKNAGMISFLEHEITDIKTRSIEILEEKRILNTVQTLNTMMKKVATLEFFKQMQAAGRTCIFSLEEPVT